MRSGSTSDRGTGESTGRGPTDAIEVQLTAALDDAERRETRYHLRQALQLVEAIEKLE